MSSAIDKQEVLDILMDEFERLKNLISENGRESESFLYFFCGEVNLASQIGLVNPDVFSQLLEAAGGGSE